MLLNNILAKLQCSKCVNFVTAEYCHVFSSGLALVTMWGKHLFDLHFGQFIYIEVYEFSIAQVKPHDLFDLLMFCYND